MINLPFPSLPQVQQLKPTGANLISTIQPAQNPELVEALAARKWVMIGIVATSACHQAIESHPYDLLLLT